LASALLCYSRYTASGIIPFIVSAGIGGFFCVASLWAILFATSDGRISRKTALQDTDKKSGFPFSNVNAEAAKKQK